MKLRPYQNEGKQAILNAWESGSRYVLYVLPTGGGKTVVFSSILADPVGLTVAVAHRREILGQISMALAVNGVRHSILGPDKASRTFSAQHRDEVGRSYIDPNARVCVASVDTLRAREGALKSWGFQVRRWVQDEAHHMLEDNKWGKVASLFPNAHGLGVTATPLRGDGRSLQEGRGGVFQTLIQGPSPRWLINKGYLADYRIFAPLSNINLGGVNVTQSGDFNRVKLAQAAKESQIVGDVTEQYRRLAPGEMGVTFVTDVKTAENLAGHFRLCGVPAVALSAESKDDERVEALKAFKSGEIKQLVNVDLFGEGFDLPAIQVVSFARPTASYGLYCQQFGRVLRRDNRKTHGKIIDHVGNVVRHGLPDKPREWSLEGGRAPSEDMAAPPLRTCETCLKLWEGYSRACPFCGHTPEIQGRSLPEQVEGDLFELDPEVLAQMRGEASKIDAPESEIIAPLQYAGAPVEAVRGLAANHRKRQQAQRELRDTMALWGGYAKRAGLSESARLIRFFREFGVDVLSAQALGKPAAEDLRVRVELSIGGF